MAEQETTEHPPGTVLQAWSQSWLLNGRLLRPAMVVGRQSPGPAGAENRYDRLKGRPSFLKKKKQKDFSNLSLGRDAFNAPFVKGGKAKRCAQSTNVRQWPEVESRL